MTVDLPILYQVAEGGPFDIQVDNGVTIENITDDLVNAKILIPDTRLQAIADAYRAWVDAQRTWNNGDEEFEILLALFNALTKEKE